jgi:HlyD family secretion protein
MLTRSLCRYSLIVSLIGICGACSFVKAEDTNTATSTADKTDENVASVVAPGRIAPKGDVIKISVANAEDSRVNQILVEEGDLVAANQVIAVLQGQDKASQQMKEAEATVAIKQAQLDKVTQGDAKRAEITAQTATIAEIEARIASETAEKQAATQEASATLRNAELKYQRYQALAQEGAVKQSERDDAQEEAERARAALSQSQAGLANTISRKSAPLMSKLPQPNSTRP